ncbi:NQO1-like protein [Mya arenaria]|uniref:NQO1-like protein n=1 Tax=Mya arenaria TaxID=6604 RepID=A0ABY7DRH9_MYAAR|nr:ribosyldihydronicotinamide dehydrogenase [quinone]-like [Mya arenaria]WAR00303.1 NQO1-like protein [Mya arenaria]
MEKKNVLIVYAHQEPKSFNGALRDVAVSALEEDGHDVYVSDLYAMKFDPVASRNIFKDLKDPNYFNFQNELSHAADTGQLADDLDREMKKILQADLIILQFPMYWLGLPAILKGWIDKCFAERVCFDTTNMKWYDHGPFVNKKLVLSFTTGGSASYFSNTGVFGDMDVLLWPIHNSLRVTGLQVLAPQIFYAPGEIASDDRKRMLDGWRERLRDIWKEDPLPFVHIDNFDPHLGFKLSEMYVQEHKDATLGPTAGQNMGKDFNHMKTK